jgi:hypothetical protein
MDTHNSEISSIIDRITTSCIDIWWSNEEAGTGAVVRHITSCLPSLARIHGAYKKKSISHYISSVIRNPFSNRHCIALRLAGICYTEAVLDEGMRNTLVHALNSKKREELIEAILTLRKIGPKAASTNVCNRLLQILEHDDFFLKGIAFDALKSMGFLQQSNVHAMLLHMAASNPIIRHLLEAKDAVPKVEKTILKYAPADPQAVHALLLDIKSTSQQKRFRAARQLENLMLNGLRFYDHKGHIILKNLSGTSNTHPDNNFMKTMP